MNIMVFTGGNYRLVLFSGKLRDECECMSTVHMIKDSQVCTEGSLVYAIIRFYFLVNIFDSFFDVDSKCKSALPQHRRAMFISSGLMCLLDLLIQMI